MSVRSLGYSHPYLWCSGSGICLKVFFLIQKSILMKECMREKQIAVQKLKSCTKLSKTSNKQHEMNRHDERLGWWPGHRFAGNWLKGVNKFTSDYGDSQGHMSWPKWKCWKMQQTTFLLLKMALVSSSVLWILGSHRSMQEIIQFSKWTNIWDCLPSWMPAMDAMGFQQVQKLGQQLQRSGETWPLPSSLGNLSPRAILPPSSLSLRHCLLHTLSWRQDQSLPSILSCCVSQRYLYLSCKCEHHDIVPVSWLPMEGNPGDLVCTISFTISPMVSLRAVCQPPSFVGSWLVCALVSCCVLLPLESLPNVRLHFLPTGSLSCRGKPFHGLRLVSSFSFLATSSSSGLALSCLCGAH